MKKLIPLSLIFLLLAGVGNLQAQTKDDPWGITVRTGLTGYNGDLGNSLFNFQNGNIAYGVGLSYYLSNDFDIALNFTSASLAKANSATDPVFSQRGTYFEANVLSLDLLLRWKFVNTFAMNDSRFNPYIAAGLGANAVSFTEGVGPNGVLTPADLTSWEFSIPVGAGMNVKLSDNLQLNVQAIYNRSFSDGIDRVSGLDKVDHDDWMTTTVGLTFTFGGPEDGGSWKEKIYNQVDGIEEQLDELVALNAATLAAIEAMPVSDRVKEELRAKFVRIVNNIQFAFDESYIIEPAKDELESLVGVMQEYKNLEIHLEAYADERGSVAYNRELASERAQSVKEFLTSRGVSASRITIDVYGEEKALYEPPSKADANTMWAQNRAVQITLEYNGS